jgi:CRISPR-associated protein Csb2
LGRWEKSQRQDGEEAPALSLTLGAAGVLRVERVVSGATPGHNLRPSTWCSASRTWVSATPLALDRHPGRVQSRDPDPAKRALAEAKSAAEAKASVALACERIGLPAPESVTILPSVSLVGTSKARQFPPFPPREGVRRAKVHVVVRFFEPVAGPLLLGAGRYVGLGLLRPVGDDDVPAAP